MPLLLIGSGLILILTGIKGDTGQLYSLIAGDFTGKNNFIYWLVAIIVLGSLGYIQSLRNLSRLFIGLVLLVLLLQNKGGVFIQLQNFINGTQNSTAATAPVAGSTAQ